MVVLGSQPHRLLAAQPALRQGVCAGDVAGGGGLAGGAGASRSRPARRRARTARISPRVGADDRRYRLLRLYVLARAGRDRSCRLAERQPLARRNSRHAGLGASRPAARLSRRAQPAASIFSTNSVSSRFRTVVRPVSRPAAPRSAVVAALVSPAAALMPRIS